MKSLIFKYLTFFSLITILTIRLHAQTIQGYVRDASSLDPISGVTFSINGKSFDQYSDENGAFSFSEFEAKEQIIEGIAIAESYKNSEFKIELTKDSILKLNIWMESYETETVVITSNRNQTSIHETGAFISKLNPQDLNEQRPRSMSEALMGVPGVWVQKTNHGGGSPFVRGLTGNQVLIMVDGIRMNNSTFRYGPNQYLATVNPYSVSSVEVVRGSGTVQYGTDAMGGVVNLLLKDPSFSNDGLKVGGRVIGKYMSGDMEKSGRAEAYLSSSKAAVYAGISYHDFGDLIAGGDLGTLINSSYTQFDGDLKAKFLIGDKNLLTITHQQLDQRNVGRYDQVAQRGYAIWEFEKQYRSLSYLRWETYTANKWVSRIRFTSSYQNSLEKRRKQRQGQDTQTREQDEINTFGQILEIISKPSPSWSAVSGIEYYYDKIGSSAFSENLTDGQRTIRPGLYPDGATASNLGVFSLHSFQKEKWALEGGLRYNLFALNAIDEDAGELTIQPQFLVGNLSAIFKPDKYNNIIASLHTGARAPNANDGLSEGFVDSGFEKQNANLAPEHSLTTEVGYKFQNDKVMASLVGYRMQLFDLIDRVPTTYQGSETFQGEKVYQKENVGKAFITGIESNFQYQFSPDWRVKAAVNYTYGQNTSKDEPLRRIPPFNGMTGLRYNNPNGLWARAEWLFAASQTRLSGGDIDDHRIPDGGTPGWNVVNLYAGWHINKVIGLQAGLQNLFDEAYRTHGSGVDGYGRSIWITLSLGSF